MCQIVLELLTALVVVSVTALIVKPQNALIVLSDGWVLRVMTLACMDDLWTISASVIHVTQVMVANWNVLVEDLA